MGAKPHLTLAKALRLKKSPIVAFVGAGGKTSALFLLARELTPALVTTSTHLGAWQTRLADTHLIWESGQPAPEISAKGVTLITGKLDSSAERYGSLKPDQLEYLHQFARFHDLPFLIEADGSRQKPLKSPAEHEPVLPTFVEMVVVVAGLSGLGKPLNAETVHRPELFSALSGIKMEQKISAEGLAQALNQAEGGLKNIPPEARRVVLLNQADEMLLQSLAGSMAPALLKNYAAVLVASLKDGKIWAVFEPVAGIILAAGAASRYGAPKQLLDYQGEPFVRQVAKNALAAGLSPVVVVTGANAEAVEAALADLPVKIARNDGWKSGQASSILCGVQSATPASVDAKSNFNIGAALFLLADQPQIGPIVLRALINRHTEGLFPITLPLVSDRRANPVLFDRVTFEDLLKLTGDVGGRALFREYLLDYLPWQDESLLLDVDNEADYQKLLAWGVTE